MKIRIQNDGQSAYMTTVTNAETGEHITNAFRFELDVSKHKDMPVAVLYIYSPVIDWTGDAEIKQICPCCGREKEL